MNTEHSSSTPSQNSESSADGPVPKDPVYYTSDPPRPGTFGDADEIALGELMPEVHRGFGDENPDPNKD